MSVPIREYAMICYNAGDEIKLINPSFTHESQQGPFKVVNKEYNYLLLVKSDEYRADSTRIIRVDINDQFTFVHLIKPYNKASEPIKTMEGLKSMFTNLFIDEPEKTFKKAGIIRDGGFLTEDGKEIFLAYLLKTNGDDFKTTVVDEIVKQIDKK